MKILSSVRIFRVIWRINAVAILCFVTIISLVVIREQIKDARRSRNFTQQAQADVAIQQPGKPNLQLGVFVQVANTTVHTADLVETTDFNMTKKGMHGAARNTLYLDTSNGQTRWLLPNSNLSIEQDTPINIPNDPANNYFARVYLIRNNDGKAELILVNPIGTIKKTLATGQIFLDSATAYSATDGCVIYHDDSNHFLIKLNFNDFSTSNPTKIKLNIPNS